MSIGSLNDYIGSTKQVIPWSKLVTRTTTANTWFSLFDIDGNPGKGTLGGTSTSAGVVPTDSTAGCPIINFSSGSGYLATVDFSNSVASRLALADMLFKAGEYAYNSGTTNLSAQPSYSSRIPGGTDYTGLQIWMECSTAFTSGTTWAIQVGYHNQAGTGSRTTTTVTPGVAQTLGRLTQLPLQSGDTGVQSIDSVIITTGNASAGKVNILVLRPLWTGRVPAAGGGDCHGLDRTGMPQVWGDSAIIGMVNADSTSSGQVETTFEIASA